MRARAALFLSVILHVTLVLLFVIHLQTAQTTHRFGITQPEVLPSYIYHPAVQQHIAEPVINKHAIALKKVPEKMIPAKKPSNTVVRKAQAQSVADNQSLPQLIALLHAAIEAQKKYPEAAMEMDRAGTATLKFVLHPDGNIEKLRIEKSSGTSALDDAAVAAVEKSAPFKNINKYLKQTQEYQIDVVFELT